MRWLITLLTLLGVVACASSPPRGEDAGSAIEQALEEAARGAEAPGHVPPRAVSDALLPRATAPAKSAVAEPRFDVNVKNTPARAFFLS
ncbi:MAG: pilus (MSHA type) biogenesis protein MshL, partial [Gammaproteobacteria bacterium]|nr:pilus (MSHA type) biogenesis protein MshL [Gammaproteobacteria bacterium]